MPPTQWKGAQTKSQDCKIVHWTILESAFNHIIKAEKLRLLCEIHDETSLDCNFLANASSDKKQNKKEAYLFTKERSNEPKTGYNKLSNAKKFSS